MGVSSETRYFALNRRALANVNLRNRVNSAGSTFDSAIKSQGKRTVSGEVLTKSTMFGGEIIPGQIQKARTFAMIY
jgi:hypothetical protein